MKNKLSSNNKAERKFQRVMHEFGQGKLKSHDEKVTDQTQAVAIAFSEARKVNPNYEIKMVEGGPTGEELQKIYKTGTAKQLWDAWTINERTHFLIDHAGQFFELMGDDYHKSAKTFTTLTYDTLSSPIRKELVIHHAMGMYNQGGGVNEYPEEMNKINVKLSSTKKKLLDRIHTLKATMANAGADAQKAIQKKIDVLQKQFDYNPSAKERAMANKGKFALDVPAKYSKAIYKKLWSMKVFPKIHTLNGTSSIVVSSNINLDKAYMVFSDMVKEKGEKVSPLAKISRKL